MNVNLERQFKRYRRQQNEINKELVEQIQILRETVSSLNAKPVFIPKTVIDPHPSQTKTDWTEIIYSTIFGIVMYFMFKKILFTLLLTGGRPVLS